MSSVIATPIHIPAHIPADDRAECPRCGAHVKLMSPAAELIHVSRWCSVCCTRSIYALN